MQALHSIGFQHSRLADQYQGLLTSDKAKAALRVKGPHGEEKSAGDGLQIFQASLSKHYQQVSTKTVAPVVPAQDQPLSAESVANNILGFIEQRLRKDEAAGASQAELEERLQQGLAGFKQGFAEAKEKIEALGLLYPEVEEEIGLTYDLVVSGIDDLRERFVASNANAREDNPVENSANKLGANALAPATASFGEMSYGQVNAFKFEVETADGDVVSISARSKELYHAEYRAGAYQSESGAVAFEQFRNYSAHSSRFHFQVNGELDEDELRALDQLLGKVEDLSADFFAGNLDAAMQQALNLGYNREEIVGYSLNLRQVEVRKVAVAYQSITPAATPINPLANKLQPLGDFAQELLDTLRTGSVFTDPVNLVGELSEQVDLNRPDVDDDWNKGRRFGDFVKSMLDALPVNKIA